jgi:BirA family biotin operon repressor/biotin-[acetyl-CoA-carboxylase] ligase
MATPYSLIVEDETASTQDDARAAYDGSPILVVAARQTRGRGRTGADWETAPRAMAASICFETAMPAEHRPVIALMAGLAAARVLGARLKWPNDVLVAGEKAGGLLVESTGDLVVVGFGLNLWWPDAPEGFGAVYAADPGPDEARDVGERWAAELLSIHDDGWDEWQLAEYRERCDTLGREVTWDPDGRGTAVDVDVDGSLVVESGGEVLRLRSGAVRHVRAG